MLTIQPKQPTLTFKAGLTPAIIVNANRTFVPGIENAFRNNYNVNAKFDNNHAISYCCAVVADIFETLTKKFNLPFGAVPPNIRIFSPEMLVDNRNANSLGFCILDSVQVLKGEPVFEARSLFINNKFKTLRDINEEAEKDFNTHWNSTNHFLHTFIHEWVHNVHTDFLYKSFGYDGACPMLRQRYNTLNGYYYDPNPYVSGINQVGFLRTRGYIPEAKNAIREEISRYAAGERNPLTNEEIGGNPFEVVAETLTKRIVNSLNPNTLKPEHNPFDENRQGSTLFQDIFNRAWNGN